MTNTISCGGGRYSRMAAGIRDAAKLSALTRDGTTSERIYQAGFKAGQDELLQALRDIETFLNAKRVKPPETVAWIKRTVHKIARAAIAKAEE